MNKVRILFQEAKEDLRISCYNKCISSAYFSCRMMAEIFLRRTVEHIPRRDDKLANLLRNQKLRREADILLFLYDMRKKADYGDEILGKEDAEKSLIAAESFLKSIGEKMGLSSWP